MTNYWFQCTLHWVTEQLNVCITLSDRGEIWRRFLHLLSSQIKMINDVLFQDCWRKYKSLHFLWLPIDLMNRCMLRNFHGIAEGSVGFLTLISRGWGRLIPGLIRPSTKPGSDLLDRIGLVFSLLVQKNFFEKSCF